MDEANAKILEKLEALVKQMASVELTLTTQGTLLEDQIARTAQIKEKVDLSLTSLGKVQQEQIVVGKNIQGILPKDPPPSDQVVSPRAGLPLGTPLLSRSGILGPHSSSPPLPSAQVAGPVAQQPDAHMDPTVEKVPPPLPPPDPVHPRTAEQREHRSLPKMDFPKFSGVDARIWLD